MQFQNLNHSISLVCRGYLCPGLGTPGPSDLKRRSLGKIHAPASSCFFCPSCSSCAPASKESRECQGGSFQTELLIHMGKLVKPCVSGRHGWRTCSEDAELLSESLPEASPSRFRFFSACPRKLREQSCSQNFSEIVSGKGRGIVRNIHDASTRHNHTSMEHISPFHCCRTPQTTSHCRESACWRMDSRSTLFRSTASAQY